VRIGLAAATAAALVPLGMGIGATPASASEACSSARHPALAARLSQDLAVATEGRRDTIAYTVWDANRDIYCARRSTAHFDSASVVKVAIMGTVLRRAQEQHRYLTSWETANLRQMITESDNNAASALWKSVGRTRLQRFLELAGMGATQLGPGGYWGLTQITAHDEMLLLNVYTTSNGVLDAASRAYGLQLMHEVIPSQRWGTPYGTPAGVTWHVKNGWLPRATHGWRVHSLGVFTGSGRDYRMAVLTEDNPTMDYGVTSIERIAAVVHRDLGGPAEENAGPDADQGVQEGPTLPTDAGINRPSDGSAPYREVTGS
jgi:hypothetical protein